MIYKKINNKEIYIPTFISELFIKESDITIKQIEEEASELYFQTLDGTGKIFFKNLNEYTGNVINGSLQSAPDVVSKIKFKNGIVYEGDVNMNILSGKGEYTFTSGAKYKYSYLIRYIGDIKCGLRHGDGKYISHNGDSIYEGSWKNGLKNDFGVLVVKDKYTYEGNWKNGIRDGYGKIFWNNGNTFEGQLYLKLLIIRKDNKICGNGVMIWKEEGEKYIGQWQNNIQNGMGIQIWYEVAGQNNYLRNRYVGFWRNGTREGYGVFFYANGSKYEGFWVQDEKHGHGEYSFIDGTSYTGRFFNNKMAEYNEHGIFALDASQTNKDHTRESSRSSNYNNVIKISTGKLKPIKVKKIIKYRKILNYI